MQISDTTALNVADTTNVRTASSSAFQSLIRLVMQGIAAAWMDFQEVSASDRLCGLGASGDISCTHTVMLGTDSVAAEHQYKVCLVSLCSS